MKKFKFISLALLLAFALMGAAFAAWSDTLTGNATLETGELDASIAAGTVSDNETTLDVASVTATSSADGNSITITIDNAYPGYEASIPFTVTNDGTIPADISDITYTGVSGALTVTDNFNAVDNLNVGDTASGTITVKVNDEANNATQNQTYRFTATINVSQFNK